MMSYAIKAVRGIVAAALLCVTATAGAQAYPSRAITFIVPYGPGGSTDPISRQFTLQLEKVLAADVNIENKPGGSGTIGMNQILRSKPDGYTIGIGTNSILAFQPLVNSGLTFKTPDEYQPIVKMGEMPIVLIVRADAPWKNFEEFVADLKKNPAKIRAAVSGLRTAPDLLAQEFNKLNNVRLTTVPFTGGGGEAMVALLGGRVEATLFTGAAGIPAQVQAGKVRVLAVFKKGKYESFPDATPTVDAGYTGSTGASFYVIAPKGLPKDVLDKLTDASMKVVRSEEYAAFAKANGYALDQNLKGSDVKAEIVRDTRTFAELLKSEPK
ncbi:MAG: hypothetical protein JWQ23_1959 [Herminiimonas sp.]|nr:hypothetical protein [Herminiimonas sp.]